MDEEKEVGSVTHQAHLPSYHKVRVCRAEEIRAAIPLGRPGTAEEIAGAVLFLASPLAAFINGEVINVNGGSVLCG